MRLQVNHHLIPTAIQSESISLEQICYKKSQGITVTSLYCLLFSTSKKKKKKKKRLKTNIKKCYHCSVRIEISLGLKVCFSLVKS